MLLLPHTLSLRSFPANPKFKHHRSLSPDLSKTWANPHRASRGPHRPFRCAGNGEVDAFTERSGYLFELTATEADSLAEYSVSKIAAIYKRKPLVLIRRLLQIGTTFGKWFGLRYLDQIQERSDLMFEVRLF